MDELGTGYNRLRVIILIILIIIKVVEGCFEDERVALLQLKSSFHFSSSSFYKDSSFYSWGGDNCCEWEGVECSNVSSTGRRITHLSVGDIYNYRRVVEWKMNASLFLPFQQLTTLSLQHINFIGDSVHNQGFDRLSPLENLVSLDLSLNTFKDINNILSSIGRISSLKSLTLSYIRGLNSTIDHIQGLARLKNLESLDLSGYGYLDNNTFSIVSGLSSLKSLSLRGNTAVNNNKGFDMMLSRLEKLESLDLSENHNLDKSILSSISNISSLKSLYLMYVGLNSTHDIQGLSKLVNLEVLDLRLNKFNNNNSLGLLSLASRISSLKTLDLSNCQLEGTIHLQELDVLNNLEVLTLSNNNINKIVASRDVGDRVPGNLNALFLDGITPKNGSSSNVEIHSLGAAYPNLKTISLCQNNFEGPIFVQGNNFSNLEELFFNYSSLDEKAIDSLKLDGMSSLKRLVLSSNGKPKNMLQSLRFFNLKNLEYLAITDNTLDNSILKDIGNLIHLKTLRLLRCGLTGILPSSTKGLCNLRNLEFLNLRSNELSGTLPQCIANLTSLQTLYLDDNHFSGSISISPLRSLTSLQDLRFSNNQFEVPLSLEPFFNHSNLKYLYGTNNHITYHSDEHDSTPTFQLETLLLSAGGNGTGNRNGAGFPKFLWNQHDLKNLDLSNIQLKGEFPYWLLENNTNFWSLNLGNTSLSGPLHLPAHSLEYLQILGISINDLNGIIPLEIGLLLPNLIELRVDNNNFSGNIPHSLLNFSDLEAFDASNNHLSGKIPGWISNISSLQVLDLSENRFSGRLPTRLGPSQIREVYLSGNMLQGSLGTSFYNCSELLTLDLSRNNFSGTIPKWIGKLTALRYLVMSHNNLEGEIPTELCSLEYLRLIDLSNNDLSGHHFLSCISVGINYDTLDEMFKRALGVTAGEIFSDVTGYMEQPLLFTTKSITLPFRGSILGYISGIDLSSNNFSGRIPPQIGNQSMIRLLNLSYNSLIGPIPESFSNLTQIESLDLSYNNLYGKIPSQLLGLTSLSSFSVAHNNLSGRTPDMVRQFATFENTSYEGNPFLCGLPLTKSCSTIVPPNTEEEEEEDDDGGFMDMEAFYVSCVISYIVVLFTIAAVLYVNPYWRRKWFNMIKNSYYFIEDNLLFPFFKFRAS